MAAGNEYQLTIDWISENPPLLLLLLTSSTGFQITWNGAEVFTTYSISCSLTTSTFYLISVAGTNQLVISGLGSVDGYGILVRNIQLRQLIYSNSTTNNTTSPASSNTTIDNSTTNNATTNNPNNTTNSTISSNSSSDTNAPASDPLVDEYSFDDL